MIDLFITDLDGCISHPFISPFWESISKIKSYSIASKRDKTIPPLTICSGRPFAYVEAVAQWLDIDYPFLFESGGGMYDVKSNRLDWHPEFDKVTLQEVDEIKQWLHDEIIIKYEGTIPEFTKFTDAGLINQNPKVVAEMFDKVEDYVRSNHERFEAHTTDISINIILRKANKGGGISWLCDVLNIDPQNVVYIGDSSGDVPGFEVVGHAYSPSNARLIAKQNSVVLESEATDAVLDVYEKAITLNRGESSK